MDGRKVRMFALAMAIAAAALPVQIAISTIRISRRDKRRIKLCMHDRACRKMDSLRPEFHGSLGYGTEAPSVIFANSPHLADLYGALQPTASISWICPPQTL